MSRLTFCSSLFIFFISLVAISFVAAVVPGGHALASTSTHTDDDIAGLYKLPDENPRCVVVVEDERYGMPALEADYHVDIDGDLATVTVTHRFENPTSRTLEPIYEFPLYEQAAVYGMTMQIGDRRVDAEIKRSEEAREIYDEAREQGQQAALLDQDRPNLFVQRVANVGPGEEVEITLRYTHALPRNRGMYHLALPLAVPERYTPSDMSNNLLVDSDGDEDPGATAGGEPTGQRDAEKPDDVSISVRIDGGMPVRNIDSPSHPIRVADQSDTLKTVQLGDDEEPTTRHFQLSYSLAGGQIELGAHSHWDDDADRGYFDLLVEPPREVSDDEIANRELVFVIDRSGSMNGDRVLAARSLVEKALGELRPDDQFRLITFSNSVTEYSEEPVTATPEAIRDAQQYTRSVTAGGGTEMVPAIDRALSAPVADDTIRMVVVLTDVQVSNEFEVIRTVREQIGGARIFAIGLGGSVNRYLLDALGRAGRGFSTHFSMDDDVDRVIDDATRRLQSPVLTDIEVDWGGLGATDVTPAAIPDVFEGGSLRLHGRFHNRGTHTVAVRGNQAGQEVVFEREIDFGDGDGGEAVRLAWARQEIRDEMFLLNTPENLREDDVEEDAVKERIIDLGLANSLTTQWTSFVAVADDETLDSGPQQSQHQQGRQRRTQPRPGNQQSSDLSVGRGQGGLGMLGGGTRHGRVHGLGEVDTSGGVGVGGSISEAESTRPTVSVDYTIDDISEGLDEDSVRRIISARKNAYQHCYERELQREPDIEGALTVEFRITSEGSVNSVATVTEDLENDTVVSCVERVLQRSRFAEPDGDEPVVVEVRFSFATDGD